MSYTSVISYIDLRTVSRMPVVVKTKVYNNSRKVAIPYLSLAPQVKLNNNS